MGAESQGAKDADTAKEEGKEEERERKDQEKEKEETTGHALEKKAPEALQETLYNVKIDGKEKAVPLSELIRNYQLEHASGKRFQEAHELAQRAKGVLDYMRRDPINGALQLIAADKGDIASAHDIMVKAALEFLKPYIEEQAMAPEMRALAQEKRSLEWQRRQLEEAQARAESERQAEAQAKAREKILHDIHQEMEKAGFNGDKPQAVEQQIIGVLRSHWEIGNPLTIPEAVTMVKNQLEESARQYLARLKPHDLKQIHPTAFQDLTAATIEAAKDKRSSTNAADAAAVPAPTDAQRRSKAREVSSRDWISDIERQVRR
jgi:hypothetical protein